MASINLGEHLNIGNEAFEELLQRLYEKFKQESESKQLLTPIENYEDRLAIYTGIPKFHLQSWYSSKIGIYKTKLLTLDEHIQILKSLSSIYKEKSPADSKSLLEDLENSKFTTNFNDLNYFEEELAKLGIKYHTFNGHEVLMEDPNLTYARFLYLQQIERLRNSNCAIYYVSERIIDQNYEFKKRQNGPTLQSPDEYVFFHAMSENGITNGMICKNPSDTDFCKWIVDILIKVVKPNSAIVLDNSVQYGNKLRKPMSMYDTKEDMYKWLQRQNVPCSQGFSKGQLYELLKRETGREELSHVEEMLQAEGFKVLKLPDNFNSLSPSEYIWNGFRKHCVQTKLNSANIKDVILKELETIIIDKYQSISRVLQYKERVLQENDKLLDNYFEKYVLDLKIKSAKTDSKKKEKVCKSRKSVQDEESVEKGESPVSVPKTPALPENEMEVNTPSPITDSESVVLPEVKMDIKTHSPVIELDSPVISPEPNMETDADKDVPTSTA